jgi:O-antigen ligase
MGLFALSIFFLVNTFVRTGLAMFVIGALPILIKKINMKYVVSGVFLIGLIAYGLSSFVDSDSVFYKRLIGKSRHNEEKTFEQAGSGRGLLFLTGLDIIKSNDSALYMIFGLGEANLKKEIKKRTGNLIVTHNGFLDLLLITGLLGFALFLYFLIKNIGIIRKSNSKLLRGLGMSIYFTIVVMVFFQDFKRIYPFLFLIIINSIIIQLLNDSNKKIDSFKEIVSGIEMANA